MRFCAMMAAPVFFCITMLLLLHPDGWKTITGMFVLMIGVMAYFNKKLP